MQSVSDPQDDRSGHSGPGPGVAVAIVRRSGQTPVTGRLEGVAVSVGGALQPMRLGSDDDLSDLGTADLVLFDGWPAAGWPAVLRWIGTPFAIWLALGDGRGSEMRDHLDGAALACVIVLGSDEDRRLPIAAGLIAGKVMGASDTRLVAHLRQAGTARARSGVARPSRPEIAALLHFSLSRPSPACPTVFADLQGYVVAPPDQRFHGYVGARWSGDDPEVPGASGQPGLDVERLTRYSDKVDAFFQDRGIASAQRVPAHGES